MIGSSGERGDGNLEPEEDQKRTGPSQWAFQILSAVGRILVPLEERRRRLPGWWPQIVAIIILGTIFFIIDEWRTWLRHEMYGHGLP